MSTLAEAEKALIEQHNHDAVNLFRTAIGQEPENALAHYGLARALLRIKDYDRSILESETAVRLDPGLAGAYVVKAYASYARKDLGAFREAALQAYELGPHTAEVLTCYGILLLTENSVRPAIESLRKAVQLDPKEIAAHRNLEYAFRLAGERQNTLQEARQIFVLSPSIGDGLKLIVAFHNAYTYVFSLLLLASLASALILRSSLILMLPLAYAILGLLLALRLLMRRQWRVGAPAVAYMVLLLAVVYAVHVLIR